MKRFTPIDPATHLLEAANQKSGFIGLIGVVNSGKASLLSQLADDLATAGRKVLFANPTSPTEATSCMHEFMTVDFDVMVMKEFRDISNRAVVELLDVCKQKLVVAGLHPGVEGHIEKFIDADGSHFQVDAFVLELARPDDLSPHVLGTA